jgi:hypothetical protein
MRRTPAVLSCAVLASLVLAGCPGSKTNNTPTNQPKSGELDKLMRTRMNAAYSQLVFLVFHAEGDPNFSAISEESGRLSDAISSVLKLQLPPMVSSDQARQIYVDYNDALKRDNDKFVEATSRQDLESMSVSLKKIGNTCSACHNFFRVKLKDQAE